MFGEITTDMKMVGSNVEVSQSKAVLHDGMDIKSSHNSQIKIIHQEISYNQMFNFNIWLSITTIYYITR
jgi:hypothetical protein